MSYLSPYDGHVHLRGEEYAEHNFLKLAFLDALAVGLCGLTEEPNPKPHLIDWKAIEPRIKEVDHYRGEIFHGMNIGLTHNRDQVIKAIKLAKKSQESAENLWEKRIVGDKTYYVDSTGNMGIKNNDEQLRNWKIRQQNRYTGVSKGHFEDEDSFKGEFDYQKPITHSLRQNPESELIQVERQIKYATDTKFQGTFVIAHTSNPDTIDFVEEVRRKQRRKASPLNIKMEMTWHHMLLNWNDYAHHKNRVKMNPPLRDQKMQERNLEAVLVGRIDFIVTDHAPHPLERKDSSEPPSGIPEIAFWPQGIRLLRKFGIDEELLQKITCLNTLETFKIPIKPRIVNVTYNPELWTAYGYNPFSRIDQKYGI